VHASTKPGAGAESCSDVSELELSTEAFNFTNAVGGPPSLLADKADAPSDAGYEYAAEASR